VSADVAQFLDYLERQAVLDAPQRARVEAAGAGGAASPVLALTRLGVVPEEVLAQHLARFLEVPLFDAAGLQAAEAVSGLSAQFLRQHGVLPLRQAGGAAPILAMVDPFDAYAAEAIRLHLGTAPSRAVISAGDLAAYFGGAPPGDEGGVSAAGRAAAGSDAPATHQDDRDRLSDLARGEPAIRLVDGLIDRAAREGASDIHIEPFRDRTIVRMRIDGVLSEVERIDPALRDAVAGRIKVMARLDVAERRLPQDGRCTATIRGRPLDIRVATTPTLFGESIVLRLLDRGGSQLDLQDLGLAPSVLSGLDHVLSGGSGLLLVTGPTGSGKTTTLYAALSRLNDGKRKILTAEDPVEYDLPGVNQIQVNPQIGLDFARILRSLLRQDPDVIMVGEIRDGETARIAVQAALTGHLVLATVHTASAAGAVARLLDMGVEPFLLASVLRGALSQRLVRRLCQECKTESPKPEGVEGPARTWWRPVGCPACRGTGYRGRRPLTEYLGIDEAVREKIAVRADSTRIAAAAKAAGMVDLAGDGWAKLAAGETTLEEIYLAVGDIVPGGSTGDPQ